MSGVGVLEHVPARELDAARKQAARERVALEP
jgi:hypothetical protein